MRSRYPSNAESNVAVGLFIFGVIAIVAGVAYFVWIQPRCLQGHYVPRWVAESCWTHPVDFGSGVTIYMTDCDPPHWTKDFVCDQYEVEKQR